MPWGQQGLGIGQCDRGTRRRQRAERGRVERQAVVDFERSGPTVVNVRDVQLEPRPIACAQYLELSSCPTLITAVRW